MPEASKQQRELFCDCGNAATHRDGSGPFCDECDAWVKFVTHQISICINQQRFWEAPEAIERRMDKKREKDVRYRMNHKHEKMSLLQSADSKGTRTVGNAGLKHPWRSEARTRAQASLARAIGNKIAA